MTLRFEAKIQCDDVLYCTLFCTLCLVCFSRVCTCCSSWLDWHIWSKNVKGIIVAIWILRDSYFSSKSSISPFVNEPSWLSCMSCFCLKGVSSIGFLLQVFGLDSQYWVNEISTLNKKRLQTFAKPQNLSNDKGNKKELSDTGVPGREPLSKGVACDKE